MMPTRATGIQDENDGFSHAFSYKKDVKRVVYIRCDNDD